MKTKLLSLLLFIPFLSQTFAQNVGDLFNDGALSYKVENLTPFEASVTGFSGATVADLVIPSSASYSGQAFTVVGIGVSAFKQKTGLVSVEFPTTLTYIRDTAFQQNSTLQSFNITNPSALTSLGRAIFAGCKELLSADFSGISADLSNSDSMFNNCTSLTSFTMQDNSAVTSIPPVFLGTCSAMTSADFTGCINITAFSDNVFRNNTSLTTIFLGSDTPPSLSFTANAQTFAYVNDGSLSQLDRTLYVPTSTGVTNFSAIPDWTDIFGTIQTPGQTQPVVGDTFDDGVLLYTIENLSPLEASVNGFSGATVADLVIPASVSYSGRAYSVIGINTSAFKQKSGLVTVEFPTTLRYIQDTAFQQTPTLQSFNLTNPSALTSLGKAIFAGCKGLLSADFSGISADLSTSDAMFNNCTSLTSFTMQNNSAVTSIPPAFLGSCSAMTYADFSGSTNITAFAENVFRNNTSLTKLYLGSDTPPSLSFTSNAQTFANLNAGGLSPADRTLYVPTTTGIANFSAIAAWTDIFGTIQNQNQSVIGDTFDVGVLSYRIENLSPLEVSVTGFSGATVANLIIPSNVSNSGQDYAVVGIATSAFKQKPGLVTVEFPTTLRYIEDTAFQQTGSLKSFILTNPGALTSLGRAVFAGCIGLESADFSGISADLSNSDSMFNNCTSLSFFTMKNNTAVTNIPPVFLGSCSAMTVANFSGCTNLTSFADNVFRNNTSLNALFLGSDTPPTLSQTANAETFAFVDDGDIYQSDRTLYVPTNTGIANFSAISEWTDIFANIQLEPQPGDTFSDEILSYKIENLSPFEVSVTGFSGATIADLVIPSTASNSGQAYSVVGISVSAFKQKSGLVSVEFPATLRYIEDTAFQQASSLQSFNLTNPSALTSLGKAIFAGCRGLLSADFSGISADLSASDGMFNNCTALTSFTMQNNTAVTSIPAVFLGSCSAMTVADFSGCVNITELSNNVFRNNTSLTTLYLGSDTPPSISLASNAQTFALVGDGGLSSLDRTLYVPNTIGIDNFSAISEWTDVFGTIQVKPIQKQVTERPLIWVTNSEKQAIIDEIANNPWKANYYSSFKSRVDEELSTYTADRKGYLSKLPFDISSSVAGQIPPFKTIKDGQANAGADRNKYKIYLQSGIDSGVLYYLTGNEDYAKYSASIFYTYLKAMTQVPLSSSGFNAGWIYPLDHLRESRDFGAQMPVLYDFIASYMSEGGTAYDFAADQEVLVNWLEAETVFNNYIYLAKERGGIASNWPALESASLAGNILALDSEAERNEEIQYVIDKRTSRQIPLSVMSEIIDDNGGIWPEPFTYSKYVAEFSTYLMTVLTKYDPSYDLVNKYANIPESLPIPNDFTFPNGNRTLHFGDGSRGFSKYKDGYEIAYHLGQLTNDAILLDKFGKLINSSIDYDNYSRERLGAQRSTAVEPYFKEPLRLLWYSGTVNGESSNFEQNVTNELPFAGISVQRNLETPDPRINGLMLFVGGAGYVHSYASGMNMELYGPKTVIGAAAGNTKKYTSTIHRNYYRLFAAHNTVIVNGASQGSGGNAGININTVEKLSIEPEYNITPVSKNNSFSTTSFIDDKGSKAEAVQYRTMGIVRTSPTTGYYVDVFKSSSSLNNEYHDYVYHNLSDNLTIEGSGANLSLTSDPGRYNGGNTSGGFNNPGWQYFEDVQSSDLYTDAVTATFTATRLGGLVNMKMFIPGGFDREYTRVNAPPTLGVAGSYDNTPTPTVVIRQNGKAWDTPFAVVYEPYYGENTNSVNQVSNIIRDGKFSGMEVLSTVGDKTIKQIILINDTDDGEFNDPGLDVEFTGRFLVLSMDENDELTSIYMGKGSHIKFKEWDIGSLNNEATSFYLEIEDKNAELNSNSQLIVSSQPADVTFTKYNDETLTFENGEFKDLNGSFSFRKTRDSDIWNLDTRKIEIDDNTYLKIVNLIGVTVLNKKINSSNTEIDMSRVTNGLYIVLLIKNNSIVGSKKIAVTR